MESIASLQNPRYKKALRLHASRGRKSQARIIVFGVREILRAIASGVLFEELMVREGHAVSDQVNQVLEKAAQAGSFVCSLSDVLFENLSFGSRNDEIIGIAARPATDLKNLKTTDRSLIVVLESVEKPGNIGAIARSADGCGADAIVLADARTDMFHPNAIRASMGAVFSIPMASDRSEAVQNWLMENEYHVFVATPEASLSLYQTEFSGRIAFVFGSEAEGLSTAWRNDKWNQIKLPMFGVADSLNVSVTASLMMYEAKRQTGLLN